MVYPFYNFICIDWSINMGRKGIWCWTNCTIIDSELDDIFSKVHCCLVLFNIRFRFGLLRYESHVFEFFYNRAFQSYYIFNTRISFSFLLGVSLGSIAASTRMKEVILPLLLIPFSIPIFLFGLKSEFRYIGDAMSLNQSLILMIFFCFFYGGLGALFQELQSENVDG